MGKPPQIIYVDPNREGSMADSIPDPLAVWKSGWTGTFIMWIILTLTLGTMVVALFTFGNIAEIKKNFPKYRCNPLAIPFAGFFGYNATENFNYCLGSVFDVKAAEVFSPIYGLLGNFTGVVELITNVTLGIRTLFSNFLLGVNKFVRNVRDKIQALMNNLRMTFVKMNNLMGKVYGSMIAVVFMGTSAMTAGMSLADNSLLGFLGEFCFAPDTPIRLADGRVKPIRYLRMGDRLAATPQNPSPIVTSVLRFDGSKTPMVRIGDVLVSAEHYVYTEGAWMPARRHKDAVSVESIPHLVCLNVTGHQFLVGESLVVADYDEHETEFAVRKTQQIAMKALNSSDENSYVADYSLGIDEHALVEMEDGTWTSVRHVGVGDRVKGGGKVLGVVQESCASVVTKDDCVFAAAQTVFDPAAKKWTRAALLWPSCVSNTPRSLRSLVTERCGTLHVRHARGDYFIRDYREVADPDMEDAYVEEFKSAE